MSATAFDAACDLIRTRRTHKSFTGAAVPRDLLERLLSAATWAPTHRLTNPWRFYVLDRPAIARLAAFLAGTPAIAAVPDPAKGAAKLAKLLERLPQAGALVMVTWLRHADPGIDLEDHAAAAAAVQNLLLAATAAGLASYWSTTAAFAHPDTLRWCGADPAAEGFLACVWLGGAVGQPEAPPRRPLAEVARFL